MLKQDVQVAFDQDEPVALDGVVGDGLAIAVGVEADWPLGTSRCPGDSFLVGNDRGERPPIGKADDQLRAREIEANTQTRADVAIEIATDTVQVAILTKESLEAIVVGVVEIVFLDPVIVVEVELIHHNRVSLGR